MDKGKCKVCSKKTPVVPIVFLSPKRQEFLMEYVCQECKEWALLIHLTT